ncbi:fused response regulator/phosphatase [Cereibacter sp. SYSU M97828]|nr:fused response regulator/phosphatase [Cereibacter flavus]
MQVTVPSQGPAATTLPHVLVVEESRAQRLILSALLVRWGYRVTEASTAEEALEMCRGTDFDIVVSDWVMQGMSGLQFCEAFRALPREGYGYFILLTSKSEKSEIAGGLDGGADDFLIKPVSPDELRARLRAGVRIMGMHSELVAKNRLISSTLRELQQVYDSLDRDLIEARKLQQTLVRDRHVKFARGAASVLLRPSGHVGGDLVGWFNINERKLALFSVDVAGHGVASAMMTARLAGLLSGASRDQNIALTGSDGGQGGAWPPEMVAYRLNRLMLQEISVDQYFTMCYAEIDMVTGRVWLVQAGHPHPMVIRACGSVEQVGAGGMPIGLIEGATWNRLEFQLGRGDRLFLLSDGVVECPDPQGGEFGEAALAAFLKGAAQMGDEEMLEALVWRLSDHRGGAAFPDDVSGMLFTYTG